MCRYRYEIWLWNVNIYIMICCMEIWSKWTYGNYNHCWMGFNPKLSLPCTRKWVKRQTRGIWWWHGVCKISHLYVFPVNFVSCSGLGLLCKRTERSWSLWQLSSSSKRTRWWLPFGTQTWLACNPPIWTKKQIKSLEMDLNGVFPLPATLNILMVFNA